MTAKSTVKLLGAACSQCQAQLQRAGLASTNKYPAIAAGSKRLTRRKNAATLLHCLVGELNCFDAGRIGGSD